MFVPIRDDNPLISIQFQYVTIALIVANIVVFLGELSGVSDAFIASFAVIPSELFGSATVPALGAIGEALPAGFSEGQLAVPEPLTLITYQFFHGDVLHLVGNMLFLWVFGDNVEDAIGHFKFLIFYLACGVFAALTHAYITQTFTPQAAGLPLIGASGSVAGVIAAYLMLHPRVRVWVLAFQVIPMQVTAALALGLWVVIQVVMVVMPQSGPVAWWAHIGGLIAGAVLIVVMRKPGVPLFDRGLDLAR